MLYKILNARSGSAKIRQNKRLQRGERTGKVKNKMRLDKFLKVSRILKRRSLAQEAAKSGRISVNGRDAKPALRLKVGDIVEIRFGTGLVKFRVENLKETVKKDEADSLYTVISEE